MDYIRKTTTSPTVQKLNGKKTKQPKLLDRALPLMKFSIKRHVEKFTCAPPISILLKAQLDGLSGSALSLVQMNHFVHSSISYAFRSSITNSLLSYSYPLAGFSTLYTRRQ